jgi:hypothetical protein
MKSTLHTKVVAFLGSKKFFYAMMVLFVLEATWVALSGRYPMAFDEDFHLGIIKLYAHQWSPFFAQQPTGGDPFGALARDPSYLYHYLASFPYRLTDTLFHNELVNIFTLRFLSIATMAAGLFTYRKALNYLKLSPAIIHTAFLFFILTPLVPFEAAQINYDNLLVPLTAAAFLCVLRFRRELIERGRINTLLLLNMLSLCLFTSLVKYTFLPIFMALAVYLLVIVIRHYRIAGRVAALHEYYRDFRKHMAVTQVGAIALFILAAGMFTQMYGYNIVRYHNPTPSCDQVITTNQCQSYGVWVRNKVYASEHRVVSKNPVPFGIDWGKNYFFAFFAPVNGIFSAFALAQPLPIIYWTSAVVLLCGTVLGFVYARKILADRALRVMGFSALVYMLALFFHNYADFVSLGRHSAEQARYLLPLLLVFYCILATAFKLFLARWRRVQVAVLVIVLLLFLQGGGLTTYIMRTDASWWWSDNRLATDFNQTAQKFLQFVIIR